MRRPMPMGPFLFPTRPTGEVWFCPRETTRFLCNLRAVRRKLLSAKPAVLSGNRRSPVGVRGKTHRRQQIGSSWRSWKVVCQALYLGDLGLVFYFAPPKPQTLAPETGKLGPISDSQPAR